MIHFTVTLAAVDQETSGSTHTRSWIIPEQIYRGVETLLGKPDGEFLIPDSAADALHEASIELAGPE